MIQWLGTASTAGFFTGTTSTIIILPATLEVWKFPRENNISKDLGVALEIFRVPWK